MLLSAAARTLHDRRRLRSSRRAPSGRSCVAFFFQNFTEAFWAEEIAAGSLTMVESTVGEPFVDADDLAELRRHAAPPGAIGRIHELTGPRLITFRKIAEIGSASGRHVAYRQMPVHDYVATLVSAGLLEEDATGLAYLFAEVLDGRNARLKSGVSDVLGREARDFRDFARNALPQPAHHG